MPNHVLSRLLGRITANIFLIVVSIGSILPIFWVLYSSLKSNDEFINNILSFPTTLQFDNYVKAFVIAKMSSYFYNSLMNTVITVIFITLFSFFLGFFLARVHSKVMRVIYYSLLAGMLIPIHSLLVPTFMLFKELELLNKFYTLWLPYIAFGLPLPVFLVDSFVRNISKEIEEAAYMDGSNIHQLIFKIIMPLCRPVFATVVILSILSVWNELVYALVLLNSETYRTLPIGLTYFTTQYSTIWTLQMAGMVIASTPIIVVYMFLSKRVMQGMTAGAVKV